MFFTFYNLYLRYFKPKVKPDLDDITKSIYSHGSSCEEDTFGFIV